MARTQHLDAPRVGKAEDIVRIAERHKFAAAPPRARPAPPVFGFDNGAPKEHPGLRRTAPRSRRTQNRIVQTGASMLSVFLLFLIPIGGGIPAGVLLAQNQGIPWPVTAGLYFVSDVTLALALEPVLRLLVILGGRVAWVARFCAAFRQAMLRSMPKAHGAGPVALILIAFGVDPMTGRTAALAAGHGFVAGWAFAIAGDMLYYGVVAMTTLELGSAIGDPETTVMVVLALMMLVPELIRRVRARRSRPAAEPPLRRAE